MKMFPFMGFPNERYHGDFYLTTFGMAHVGVKWKEQKQAYFVFMWGTLHKHDDYWCNDELSVLGVLHHIKNEVANETV